MVNYAQFIKPMRFSAGLFFRFFLKYYYFVILVIVLTPVIVSSINDAVEQNNPYLPLIQVAKSILDSDAQIYSDVQTLKTNPEELIGMEKPASGLWVKTKYMFLLFWRIVFREFSLLWAIMFPFVVIFRYNRYKGKDGQQSSVDADIRKSIIFGLLFLFVMNLIFIVVGFIDGTIVQTFPSGITDIQKATIIITKAIPFHGVGSLIVYIISLFSS